jgi:hypothetical protein
LLSCADKCNGDYACAIAHFSDSALSILTVSPNYAQALTDISTGLAKVGQVMLGVGKGVALGAIDSVTAPLTLLAHPVDAVQGLGQIVKGVGQLCSLGFDAAKGDPKAYATIDKALTEFMQMPCEEQAENLARFATTMFMPLPKLGSLPGIGEGIKALDKIAKSELSVLKAAGNIAKEECVTVNGVQVARAVADNVAKLEQKCGRVLTAEETLNVAESIERASLEGKAPLTCAFARGVENEAKHATPRFGAQAIEAGTISFAGYDASLGNLEKLEEAANMFKTNPSAVAKDGPLTKLLQTGKTSSPAGNLATARGAAYELEKAYALEKTGEEIIGFGKKLPLIDSETGRVLKCLEIDIETSAKLIECKNWDWTKVSFDRIGKLKSNLPDLQKIATSKGKTFEFHSKNSMPQDLKLWLNYKNIVFKEG